MEHNWGKEIKKTKICSELSMSEHKIKDLYKQGRFLNKEKYSKNKRKAK